MEFRDFEYFVTVAEFGNVGRAAESLGLSQPALSKCLRRLEATIQARLVKRTPKGIELTPAGTMLLSQVQRLRLSLNDVIRTVAELSEGRAGHIRVGAGAAIADELVPAACGELLRAAPNVKITISVDTVDNLVPLLLAGKVDLVVSVISGSTHGQLVRDHLLDEEMVVIAAAGHRLAGRKRIPVAELAEERWTLSATNAVSWQWMNRIFEDHGLDAPVIAMTGPTSLRLPTIASSKLLGFSAKRTLKNVARRYGLVELNVSELRWTRRIGVMYRKGDHLAPVVHRLVELLGKAAGRDKITIA